MGILEWGIYGRGSYGKVSCCFVGIYSKKKSLVFREVYSFWSSHDYGFQKTGLQRSTLSGHHITMGRGGEGGKGGGTSSMLLHWCYHQHLHQGWHLDRSCGYYSRLSLIFNTGLATSYSTNSAQSYTFCTLCSWLLPYLAQLVLNSQIVQLFPNFKMESVSWKRRGQVARGFKVGLPWIMNWADSAHG